jgi:hypothetical protein
MAHLECRRRGDRVSASSQGDQTTVTDGGFVGWLLSLGICFEDPYVKSAPTTHREL